MYTVWILAFVYIILLYDVVRTLEISCDKISGSRQGRKYCFIRNSRSEQYSRITVRTDNYANDRKEIIFDNCSMHKLPEGLFIAFPNLNTIYMWNTGVHEISRESFINANELIIFDLSYNNISTLDSTRHGVFSSAKKLQQIFLDHNQIDRIAENSFDALSRLKHLHLDHNRIETIHLYTFAPLVELRAIHLNRNRIKYIAPELFRRNTKLKWIHLHDNQLGEMDGIITFKHLMNVQEFYIRNNLLANLSHIAINSVQIDVRSIGLNGLYIGNRTERMEATHNNIQYVIVANNSNTLRILDLAHNNLSYMANLTHLNQLIELDLSNNNISDIGIHSFANMSNLEILKLRDCNLTFIMYGLFAHKTKLRELDLSFNHLNHIDFNMFSFMTKLTILHLNGNNLMEVDVSDFNKLFPQLAQIGIAQNNWECEKLASIVKYFDSAAIEMDLEGNRIDVENINGVPCHSSSRIEIRKSIEKDSVELQSEMQRASDVPDTYTRNIQYIRENCQLSLARTNDMDLILKLIELKYDVSAYNDGLQLISLKIETLLNTLHRRIHTGASMQHL